MKNTDKTIPYEPTSAELARYRIRLERTTDSSYSRDEEDEKTAGELTGMNHLAILAVLVVLVVVVVIMIGALNSPASLTTVSWNG